jgi:RNA polymerase sigma-70 factor, ECF subfamily
VLNIKHHQFRTLEFGGAVALIGGMVDRDEHAALAAARTGDPVGFERLVKLSQRRAYATALGILRHPEDARDACQEAYLRAYQNLPRFDGASKFSTWLVRIVINVCLDKKRRHEHPTVALDDAALQLAGHDNPARTAENGELLACVRAALDRLSAPHRTAIVLREVAGLSYHEIAAATHCSVGTVMSRLFHARRRLQAHLRAALPAEALAA